MCTYPALKPETFFIALNQGYSLQIVVLSINMHITDKRNVSNFWSHLLVWLQLALAQIHDIQIPRICNG